MYVSSGMKSQWETEFSSIAFSLIFADKYRSFIMSWACWDLLWQFFSFITNVLWETLRWNSSTHSFQSLASGFYSKCHLLLASLKILFRLKQRGEHIKVVGLAKVKLKYPASQNNILTKRRKRVKEGTAFTRKWNTYIIKVVVFLLVCICCQQARPT